MREDDLYLCGEKLLRVPVMSSTYFVYFRDLTLLQAKELYESPLEKVRDILFLAIVRSIKLLCILVRLIPAQLH